MTEYVLVLPFSVGNGAAFALPSDSVPLVFDGASTTLRKRSAGFELCFEGLPSEEAARAFLPNAFSALTSLMLDLRAPISATWEARTARRVRSDSPNALSSNWDAFADAEEPYVAEMGSRVGVMRGFPVTVTITVPHERAIAQLERGLAEPGAEAKFANQRIRTAVALHTQAFEQQSPTAALLMRSMVFEALVPPTRKNDVALELLARWEQEVMGEQAKYPEDSEAYDALDSLLKELVFRKDSSIRSRLRSYVQQVLAERPDASNWGKKVRDAYDLRSKLLHEGHLPHELVSKATTDFHEAAELVLAALLFPAQSNAA